MQISHIGKFKGLNNKVSTTEHQRVAKNGEVSWWMASAINVDVTDAGDIKSRPAYEASVASTILSVYQADDGRVYRLEADALYCDDKRIFDLIVRGYPCWAQSMDKVVLLADGELYLIAGEEVRDLRVPPAEMFEVTLTSGQLIPGDYQVAVTLIDEVGREGPATVETVSISQGAAIALTVPPGYRCAVYVSGPNSSSLRELGVIATSGTYPLSPGEGAVLTNAELSEPPEECDCIAQYQGRLVMSQYNMASNTSAIWMSEAFAHHLFDMESGLIMVPGRVTNLVAEKATGGSLGIVTDEKIYLWDGEALNTLANYGGHARSNCVTSPKGEVFFWTDFGLCALPEFKNLMYETFTPVLAKEVYLSFLQDGSDGRIVSTIFQ